MKTEVKKDVFKFKKFSINQDQCGMKVCTDGVLLGAWADLDQVGSALDIGTGTGVIAIMLAQRGKNLTKITGVEVDEASYYQALENTDLCPWSDKLEMVHQSIQEYSSSEINGKFDLIISNPPFFTGGTLSESQTKNRVRHTVKLPHSDLLRSVKKLLDKKGHFSLILPDLEGYRFIEMAEQYGFYLNAVTKVRPTDQKPGERLLLDFVNLPVRKVAENELVIKNSGSGEFTEEYRELVQDFYLNF